MHVRVAKRESAALLTLTLQMFADAVELRLDKEACFKCDICATVCPREAVSIICGDHGLDITIDPRRCLLCEICAHFCPVAAVTLTYNGQAKKILTEHRGLAPFLPKIALDASRCTQPCPEAGSGDLHWCRQQLQLVTNNRDGCPKRCHKCLDACPRQAIGLDEAGIQTVPALDKCLRCRQCLAVCEFAAIAVNPQFLGRLIINDRRCPPDCVKCIELCPVKAIVREEDRVFIRPETCAYCGACVNICDEEAISLTREEVVAEAGEFSQAWKTAVQKLLNLDI